MTFLNIFDHENSLFAKKISGVKSAFTTGIYSYTLW